MANKELKAFVKRHEKRLRAEGWMTIEEFMERIEPAMRQYLKDNWGTDDDNAIHHPEDLSSHALSFMEAIFQGIQAFGAGPIK